MISFFFINLLLSANVHADVCTIPSSSVEPEIRATAKLNKKEYIYSYVIGNGRTAPIGIDYFALNLKVGPSNAVGPGRWHPHFTTDSEGPNLQFWGVSPGREDIPKDPNQPILKVAAAVNPGQRLDGFTFKSSNPPGIVQYYVEGYTQHPYATEPVNGDYEAEPNCPGWDFDSPAYKSRVTGMTIGPRDPAVHQAALRLRNERGDHHCGDLFPEKTKGKISVLVLASDDLDPSQIDLKSIQFGPADAAPVATKLVPLGGENLAKWDEHEAWEKEAQSDALEKAKQKRRQNLQLVFDFESLQARCGLDRALFLHAKLKDGSAVFGGASTHFAGCNTALPGVRSQKSAGRED